MIRPHHSLAIVCLFFLAACSNEASNAQSDTESTIQASEQEEVWNTHPQWEWQGERIAYVRGVGDKAQVMIVGSDGSGRTAITPKTAWVANPTWSPRFGKIGFIQAAGGMDGEWDIWTSNSDGSEASVLIETADREMHTAWDVAGIMLAHTKQTDGQSDVWLANARNGKMKQVTDSPDSDEYHPKWSAEGNRVVYEKVTGDQREICISDVIMRREFCLNSLQGMNVRTPAFSRSGATIVFARTMEGEETSDLWEVDVASGAFRQLTATPDESEAAPFYSPDESRIAFHSNKGGVRHVYVMQRDGSNRIQISE